MTSYVTSHIRWPNDVRFYG